ncbi:hypothetical protein DID88_001861 [Monilinia fructigena]|uniref:Uncharacterized protein n=1 Tax=Monilinia fructigena TaxID=38457 RepID=A0A395IVQ9_9HELO|nr:hypothetical protein DID88_001861 [Monilinia fructigena]
MTRTKNASRKGGASGKENRDNPKRKREEATGAEGPRRKGNFPSTFQELDQDRPSKKSKPTTTPTTTTSAQTTSSKRDNTIPPPPSYQEAHQVSPTKNVKSPPNGHNPLPPNDPPLHPLLLPNPKESLPYPLNSQHLLLLRPIAPRRPPLRQSPLGWYQYNVVGELVTSHPRKIEAEKEEDDDVEMRDEGEGEGEGEGEEEEEEEEEEKAFETMKTPFERALDAEGKPKIRSLATLTLYLSRVRIESLRKIYGEQTNALT